MSENNLDMTIPTLSCEALVVGGGIAGCWTALKLLERGIDTLLVYYQDTDRGGRLGSTNLSVGAISTAPIERKDYATWLDDLGRGQVQSSVVQFTVDYLPEEIEELKKFDSLKSIELGVALASGSGKRLVEQLIAHLVMRGVRVIQDAWLTRIDADTDTCRGIQYQQGNRVGTIATGALVLAPGGYSGLFHGAVKTGTFGSVHARFLQAGGKLSNVEFIFKHGYGQPDLGKLTPTEELPGVEIYDQEGVHVQWLEEELFYGRGTHNHFQAFMTWRKDENKKYFVDFRYCEFHRAIKSYLASGPLILKPEQFTPLFSAFVEPHAQQAFCDWFNTLIANNVEYTYSDFQAIKPWLLERCPEDRHRIRQIAYFSMGGIMHHGFLTNLKNVFVNGEAMHDYGAHRVGGLPWALYLCAARKIAEDILALKLRSELLLSSVSILPILSNFDAELLQEIQYRLYEFQERGRDESRLNDFLQWLRFERRGLQDQHRMLDDSYAYLLLAEAIVKSSIDRKESRGCFFRSDYIKEDSKLKRLRTIASYSALADEVIVTSVDKSHILDLVFNRNPSIGCGSDTTERKNAAYFLLKKHLGTDRQLAIAIETDDSLQTYEELNQLVDQYAFFLFSQGVVFGDRVAILLQDSPHWIALFLACLQIGAIAVPLNTYAKTDEMVFFLKDSQAKLLLSEQQILSCLNLDALTKCSGAKIVSLEDLLPLQDEKISGCVPVGDETIGFILYTSGTTGKPKGALHTHANLECTAKQFALYNLQPVPTDKFYSSSRLYFAYGLGNSLTFPLFFGCTSRLTKNKLLAPATLALLSESEITHFFSIPAIYNQLLPALNPTSISSTLKICVSAGEPLSENIARRWVNLLRKPLIDGIGSTEALHIFCCTYYGYHEGLITKVQGKPVAGYQLKLLDDAHSIIKQKDLPGGLAVQGKSLARAYWNNSDATRATFVGDLLLTGDRYLCNALNEYIYLGRSGDMYKVSGLWVSALDIECILKDFDCVSDAALAVCLDEYGAQYVTAFVVPCEPYLSLAGEELSEKIFSQLQFSLSKYKVPDYLYLLAELPRTSTGKVNKLELKALAIERRRTEREVTHEYLPTLHLVEVV